MFYSISGNIIASDANSVAVECSGVAFKCNASLNTLKKIGSVGNKVTLYTYLSVKEDALDLFGFYDLQELDCFKLLIAISGVGPKAALAVLSEMTPEQLALAVSKADHKAVTKAQGVGPKLAQRIVLELKGKLSVSVSSDDSDIFTGNTESASANISEAVSALQFLGYTQHDASKAVKSLDASLSVEEMIKRALVLLAKNL